MTVRIWRTHELTIPIQIGGWFSRISPGKIDVTRKIRYLVEETDWDQNVLKGEKWIDLFCWSVLGIAALYFGVVCLEILMR
jgi:hypothetical protein